MVWAETGAVLAAIQALRLNSNFVLWDSGNQALGNSKIGLQLVDVGRCVDRNFYSKQALHWQQLSHYN